MTSPVKFLWSYTSKINLVTNKTMIQ